MRTNHFKEVTKGQGLAWGISLTVTDTLVAEIIGAGSPDFVMIDTEHAPLGPETLQNILVALRTAEATSLVRVSSADEAAIGMALDLGAEGVIIPGITTGDACRHAVGATRYAPAGNRGLGPRRAARLQGGRAAYLSRSNEEVAAVVMVEHVDALSNLHDILSVDGLDAVMAGPADLAVSMGHLTEPGHADVEMAIDRVRESCAAHGIPFGIFAAAESSARKWAERGASFIILGADLQFIDQGLARVSGLAKELRESASRLGEP